MTVEVLAGWLPDEPEIGRLEIRCYREKEVISFGMDPDWMASDGQGLFLDPDLSMFGGKQYAPEDKPAFGFSH